MMEKLFGCMRTRISPKRKKAAWQKTKRFVPLLELLEERWVPSITEYNVPDHTGGHGLSGITAGPDSNLWFTDWANGEIGKITISGTATEWKLQPYLMYDNVSDIASGPLSALWFVSQDETQGPPIASRVGKVTTGTPTNITEYTPWNN